MKTKQINAILVEQPKRRKKIALYLCVIFVVLVLAVFSFMMFIDKNKTYSVPYYEDSKIDYKVYLKKNKFFESNYLGSNNQYIASLISYITADFDYKLRVDKADVDYKYKYRIEAVVDVVDKNTKNSLYTTTETLVEEKTFSSTDSSSVNIHETLKISYNDYNNLIKKFVNIYQLDNAVSNLVINMYVDVVSESEKLEDSNTNSVISMTIPLTTKTVAVDIGYDLVDSSDQNYLVYKKDDSNYYIYVIACVTFSAIAVCLIVSLLRYIVKTRTAETIYDRELKKILNNYKSYIQKINNDFDLEGYQVLKVDAFTDMLEIRDTIQEPILMVENKAKTGVFFLIPSKTKILYLFGLKVSEIKKQMKKG